MSIVSVSRLAGPPQCGQVVFKNVFEVVIGDLPTTLKSTSFGHFTGKSFSSTGTIPHLSQYTTGIGAPQYL